MSIISRIYQVYMRFDSNLDYVPIAMFFSKKEAKEYVKQNITPYSYDYKIVKVKSVKR